MADVVFFVGNQMCVLDPQVKSSHLGRTKCHQGLKTILEIIRRSGSLYHWLACQLGLGVFLEVEEALLGRQELQPTKEPTNQ